MALVPINITGQTYSSRSRPLSRQTTQNMYAELVDNQAAKSEFVLLPYPGCKVVNNTDMDGPDRGMLEHKGILYKVSGEKLYSVTTTGAHTELGTVPGVGRCILNGIGNNVVITTASTQKNPTDGKAYYYNGTTVTQITDADLQSPKSNTHLNNQIIYDGNNGIFVVSDVADATTIDGLSFATAESNADELLRVYAFNELLYLFGEKTIEVWQNTGLGNTGFAALQGAELTIGLEAIHSVSNNDDFMYFLADDNHVYRIQGTAKQRVTTKALHSQISSFAQTFDAIGFCYTMEGHNFYQLSFPGQAKAFLFSEDTGWFNLASGKDSRRHYSNSYAYAFRKHLVGDYRNSNIYELDVDTFTDNLEPIIRIRDTGPIHGGLFGRPGKRLTMNYFELIVDTGVGLLEGSGQGEDPDIMLSYSDDGGQTFGNEIRASIGKKGEFQKEVRWNVLGSFYERVIRIRMSDPVFLAIHSAVADIEVGI